MRILHIVEAHTIHTGRIADYQIAKGHDVLVATFHDGLKRGPVREIPRKAWVRRLPYHHHWTGISDVVAIARIHKPDVLHGHYLSTAALYLAIPNGGVTIGSAVGSDLLIDPRAMHARLLLRASRKWISRFTSVAPHVTRRMIALGIPASRIQTFPWGVDTEIFHTGPIEEREPVIISTRSFEPVYGLETLLEAFAQIARSSYPTTLRLFGEGSGGPWLRARARSLPGSDRISFEGRSDPLAISQALRAALVYVSASKSDGASASLLESMATGIVPVVTDIEANRAWITDGQNGLLFPVGDARALASSLDSALRDRELAARCRERNPRIISERASFGVSMERLQRVYREAMSS